MICPQTLPPWISTKAVEFEPTYPGDRILVNKYGYDFNQPNRWDVVVFKFPGNGEMNYIKRLVGLPNEEIKIFQGDIFTRPLDRSREFSIERKPPDKVQAMLQPVHDTDYDPAILYDAGWPLRWSDAGTDGWEVVAETDGKNVSQQYKFTAADKPETDAPIAWLRYRHLIPGDNDWAVARHFAQTGQHIKPKAEWLASISPELITDFNPYNAAVQRQQLLARHDLSIPQYQLGMNWVSDLAVVCDVDVHEARGELLLDLVEGGKHFTCRHRSWHGQGHAGNRRAT